VATHAVLPAGRDTAAPGAGDQRDDDLESLRSILIGPAEHQLQALQARMDDRFAHAREVSAVLPQALVSRASDPELARALMPPVEQAITASVRRDPKPLADAIFPVMGPAIRRAVAAALSTMVESLNRTIEHSFSWRALKWRIEAFRTGKPFGEVLLLHTLVYRVEQVLLIHRKTGLLLHHLRAESAQVEDPQLVSALLTAIRDFAQDSYRISDQESVSHFHIGGLTTWVEPGPAAIVATVFRGNAPREHREILQRAVEAIHLRFADALEAFDGDTGPFDATHEVLETCLQTEYRAEKRSRGRAVLILAGLALLALGIWLAFALVDRARWGRYLDALRNEPGLVVISSGRSGGRHVVTGLRDPIARDPQELIASSRLSADDVIGRWEPYQALTPSFVLTRARRALQPPAGVTLAFNDGVLSAAGEAPAAWIVDARRIAPVVAGVSAFDASALLGASTRAVARRLEASPLLFARGTTAPLPGQEQKLRTLAADVRELDALAAAAGRPVRVDVVGHADADGAPVSNLPLSLDRAEWVLNAVGLTSREHLDVRTHGAGSGEPLVADDTDDAKRQNRRVTIRVPEPGSGAAPGPAR
jgi:outer membrane protein OmpA-like peptidoglycan-associated protein